MLQKLPKGRINSIPSETWNTLIDMARISEQSQRFGDRISPDAPEDVVYAINESATPIEPFTPVYLGTLAITVDDNMSEFLSASWPFKIASADQSKTFGIVQELIPPGFMGRVKVSGISPVKLRVESANDVFAIPDGSSKQMVSSNSGAKILWKQATSGICWAVVRLDSSDNHSMQSSFPCRITGGSTAGGYTVDIHANGKNQAKTGTGTLEVLELLRGDNLRVGSWIVGHRTSVTITGGTD